MEKTMAKPRIERGFTKIAVPHEEEEIAFAYPSIGPNTYQNVGKQILEAGQNVPTGDETASLLYAAYCVPEVKNEPEFQNVRDIMRNRWLWVFNRNLWTSKGVYVVQDFEALGRSQPLKANELEETLKGGKEIQGIRFSHDNRTRFAPKDSYNLGEHTAKSLAKDGFVVAGYGVEGAEKLGEVSTKFRYAPKTWGVNVEEGQTPVLRVSALVDDVGVGVVGYWYDVVRGHAFGVTKEGEQ